MVNNPQMEDLQRLTADNFTKETGIRVNYTVLPENDVRAKISQEFSSSPQRSTTCLARWMTGCRWPRSGNPTTQAH